MPEDPLSDRPVLMAEDEYLLDDKLDRVLCSARAAVLGPAPPVETAPDLLGCEPANVAPIA